MELFHVGPSYPSIQHILFSGLAFYVSRFKPGCSGRVLLQRCSVYSHSAKMSVGPKSVTFTENLWTGMCLWVWSELYSFYVNKKTLRNKLNGTGSGWSWQVILKPQRGNSVFRKVFEIRFIRISSVCFCRCWWFEKKTRAKITSAFELVPTVLTMKSFTLTFFIMHYYTCMQSACFHLITWELLVSFQICCTARFMGKKVLQWNSLKSSTGRTWICNSSH